MDPALQIDSPASDTRPVKFTETKVARSFEYCAQLARSRYENFPVGSLLIPANRRKYVYAIYAFARIADDIADEEPQAKSRETRLDQLDDWSRQLDECLEGRAKHEVFPALAATIHEMKLPVELLRDLLSAFRQDVEQTRYRDFGELLDYCRRSANPIGRLVLMLFGYRDDERAALSDKICTALQLANFWQDVSEDVGRERIYIPIEDMQNHRVTESQILHREYSREFADLLSVLVARTRALFEDGRPLLEKAGGRLKYELRLTWIGGMRILDKIESSGFDTLRSRPRMGSLEKAGLLLKALISRP